MVSATVPFLSAVLGAAVAVITTRVNNAHERQLRADDRKAEKDLRAEERELENQAREDQKVEAESQRAEDRLSASRLTRLGAVEELLAYGVTYETVLEESYRTAVREPLSPAERARIQAAREKYELYFARLLIVDQAMLAGTKLSAYDENIRSFRDETLADSGHQIGREEPLRRWASEARLEFVQDLPAHFSQDVVT